MRIASLVAAMAVFSLVAAAPRGSLSGKVICLDPGHLSENGAGASGKKIGEVRANWRVACKLKALLQERGARVVMTKTQEKELVTNRRRAEMANAAGVALMVRLHCDSGGGRGRAIYSPARPGRTKGFTGPSRQVITASTRAAKAMYPVIIKALVGKVKAKGLRSDAATYVGSKQGALTGSIYSRVPVVLVEMVTLSHRGDDVFIASDAGQTIMARAITAGIMAGLK
jgi:N-acetylmuramoyl-L-alanine amidase